MPRFTYDPKNATSGFLTYPKGTYLVELGEPFSFAATGKNGENYGVKFPGKIKSSIDQPAFVNKPWPQTLYLHTDGACNYSKAIQMAALGCRKDQEFNDKYGDEDWSYNTDDKSCGAGWHLMKGQVIVITAGDVTMNDKGDEQTGQLNYSVNA